MISEEIMKSLGAYPFQGARFNVIRRPLSGGKGTIVRHKGSKNKPEETKEAFYRRLAQYIKDDPDHFFMRWNVEITPQDIEAFRRKSLDPILEQLCDWWDWVKYPGDPFVSTGKNDPQNKHFVAPFGIWNPLLEGASTEYDELLVTGSEVGLSRTEELFPELV